MQTLILIIFTFLLFVIFLYSLSQLNLLWNYLQKRKQDIPSQKWHFTDPLNFPFVTIQLPVFNERPVIERLLKNIAEIDYPHERLEIQVLDDSTDDSVVLTGSLINDIKQKGLEIQHICRANRVGFKAGALKEGLVAAKGEFIAVFDSDFLPGKSWLKETLPHFYNDKVGVVQTRWDHVNRNFSLLTRLQAFLLDFHFLLEQNGRSFGGHFINFNGTAGIWRKSCILDAGNWESDTLTEDLDLSYRAQLKGWKFIYLDHIETPAELPVTIEAARSQQFRWNKGAAENFQKNFKKLLLNKNISGATKIHSFFHLLNSSLFLLVLLLAILSVPMLLIKTSSIQDLFVEILICFSLSTIIFFTTYWVAFKRINGGSFKSFLRFIGYFFIFFSIAMGFSLHNSAAVLEGHLGKKSEFIRTPKFNIFGKNKFEVRSAIDWNLTLVLEILLMFLFGFAILMAFQTENYTLLLFHFMLFFGFFYVVFQSLHFDRVFKRSFPKTTTG